MSSAGQAFGGGCTAGFQIVSRYAAFPGTALQRLGRHKHSGRDRVFHQQDLGSMMAKLAIKTGCDSCHSTPTISVGCVGPRPGAVHWDSPSQHDASPPGGAGPTRRKRVDHPRRWRSRRRVVPRCTAGTRWPVPGEDHANRRDPRTPAARHMRSRTTRHFPAPCRAGPSSSAQADCRPLRPQGATATSPLSHEAADDLGQILRTGGFRPLPDTDNDGRLIGTRLWRVHAGFVEYLALRGLASRHR